MPFFLLENVCQNVLHRTGPVEACSCGCENRCGKPIIFHKKTPGVWCQTQSRVRTEQKGSSFFMNYTEYVPHYIRQHGIGEPIYSKDIAKSLETAYGLEHKHAVQLGTATASRCIDEKLIPNLRKYDGVYYLVDLDKTPEENLELYRKK